MPLFYLRGFADQDKVATVRLPGEKRFVQSIRDASVLNNFYALEGHQDGDDVIERALSEVEGAASSVIKQIVAGTWPLSYNDRMNLGYFISLQAARVPTQRETTNHLARQLFRMQVGINGKVGVRRRLEEQGGVVTDELIDEVWELATRPEGPPIERPVHEHIKQMLEMSEELLKYMVGRPWSLVEFDRRSLLTSDAPVTLVKNPKDEEWRGVGFMTAWGITFPLTRKLGLLMGNIEPVIEAGIEVERVHHGEVDMWQLGTTQMERFFNYGTIGSASEWIFHHPDDSRFVPDDLPEPNPVKMSMDPMEFDGEAWFSGARAAAKGATASE